MFVDQHQEGAFLICDALKLSRQVLRKSVRLVARDLVDTESEQLVIACLRKATHRKFSRNEFYLNLSDPFPESAVEDLKVRSEYRAAGRPLQHLIGYQFFGEHEYQVSSDVLVPRPETEVVLRAAIQELIPLAPKNGIEVGIGSGALSIELLAQFPELTIFASEFSQEAAKIALANSQENLSQSERLVLLQARTPEEVWEPFERLGVSSCDFIISNPPYLTKEDEIDDEVITYEPHEALFAPGFDPLYFYRKIAENAEHFLNRDGYIFLELPHERAHAISELFKNWDIRVLRDLSQRARVLVARRRFHG